MQPSLLPVLHWRELCWDFYYYGNCRLEDQCPRKHTICHVQGVPRHPEESPSLNTEPNRLSLSPRLPHAGGPFDDDGPADLSWLGPRHNNDFLEVCRRCIHHFSLRSNLRLDSPYSHPTNNGRNIRPETPLYAAEGPGQ